MPVVLASAALAGWYCLPLIVPRMPCRSWMPAAFWNSVPARSCTPVSPSTPNEDIAVV